MKFYKNNAYPDVFLHDCQCKMMYDNQNLRLLFDNGFCIQTEKGIEQVKGYIQISDIPLSEITIRGYKRKNFFRKYVEIVKEIPFSELCQILTNASLEIIDEYYSWGQVLYKCCIYPYPKQQVFDRVEIVIFFENRMIEYYIEK